MCCFGKTKLWKGLAYVIHRLRLCVPACQVYTSVKVLVCVCIFDGGRFTRLLPSADCPTSFLCGCIITKKHSFIGYTRTHKHVYEHLLKFRYLQINTHELYWRTPLLLQHKFKMCSLYFRLRIQGVSVSYANFCLADMYDSAGWVNVLFCFRWYRSSTFFCSSWEVRIILIGREVLNREYLNKVWKIIEILWWDRNTCLEIL